MLGFHLFDHSVLKESFIHSITLSSESNRLVDHIVNTKTNASDMFKPDDI